MTKEEILNGLYDIKNWHCNGNSEMYSIIAETIKFLERDSEWIPVNKELPKPGEYEGNVDKYYLVQNEYEDMMVARYTHSEYWEQIYQIKPIADEIVAWMPLPKTYKVESVEDVETVKDQLPCGEQMDFPNTFDEFAKDYGFKDKEEVYTNGSELISVFRVKQWLEHISTTKNDLGVSSGLEKTRKKLEKDFGESDCISRADVNQVIPQEPRCKECKYWKDSDGVYRRGCRAESKCPINRREVFEGNGYCYLFEPRKVRDK